MNTLLEIVRGILGFILIIAISSAFLGPKLFRAGKTLTRSFADVPVSKLAKQTDEVVPGTLLEDATNTLPMHSDVLESSTRTHAQDGSSMHHLLDVAEITLDVSTEILSTIESDADKENEENAVEAAQQPQRGTSNNCTDDYRSRDSYETPFGPAQPWESGNWSHAIGPLIFK